MVRAAATETLRQTQEPRRQAPERAPRTVRAEPEEAAPLDDRQQKWAAARAERASKKKSTKGEGKKKKRKR